MQELSRDTAIHSQIITRPTLCGSGMYWAMSSQSIIQVKSSSMNILIPSLNLHKLQVLRVSSGKDSHSLSMHWDENNTFRLTLCLRVLTSFGAPLFLSWKSRERLNLAAPQWETH